MNRKDSLIAAGARNYNNNHIGILRHRRSTTPLAKNNSAENFNNSSNNIDMFLRNRTNLPAASSDDSDMQARLARLSVGSAKPAKSILDDLLATNETGKNDYDWLLTPPETPLFTSKEGKESQPKPVAARSKSSVRSSSINKTSTLSISQSETNYPARPARSSSVTRSSISTTQYTNYPRNTNILNTSSASVSSYIRPSTPTNRSATSARQSTPSATSARTTLSGGSTPSRTRPSPTATTTTRPLQNSRPTPTSTLNSPTLRPITRPSTPARRTVTPSVSQSTTPSVSSTRGSVGSTSQPSSPSPRIRPPPQQNNHTDFSHETPPNLKTTLPDRPLSAGRSRPNGSTSTTIKGNLEPSNSSSITRRHSSPTVTRGRIVDSPGRGRNGNLVESLDSRRISLNLPDLLTRKPIKSTSSDNGTGYERNISKKSLDMAIKHMDIRNGNTRPTSGSTLFPQSIRTSNSRTQPGRASSALGSVNGSLSNGYTWNKNLPLDDHSPHSSKLSSEVEEIYESSRYDTILLKEDLKNTSWLHSANEKIDEGSFFDNGFVTLLDPCES